MSNGCTFCEIVSGAASASIVFQDELTIGFIDLRQFHPGHTLVVPRQHFHDLRDLDPATGAALMATVSQVTRAVAATFPNQGLSVWHSIGEAAFQEVPHLHFHVHPRIMGDDAMRIYPRPPATPNRSVLDEHAAALRSCLQQQGSQSNNSFKPNPHQGGA